MESMTMPPPTPEAGLGVQAVRSKARHIDELPSYVVPDTGLEMGSSFGNSSCWVTTKGTGDIENLFSTFIGQHVTGAICLRYSGIGRPLSRFYRPQQDGGTPAAREQGQGEGQIQLYSQAPGVMEIHPAYQRHQYECPGNISIEETVFVPNIAPPDHSRQYPEMEAPIVYQAVRLRNDGALTAQVRVYGHIQFQGATAGDLRGDYDSSLGQGTLVAHSESRPDWVRLFGVASAQTRVARWETGFDDRQVYETTNVRPLRNDTSASGAILGALQVDVELQPGESTQLAFITVFSHEGEAKARHIFQDAWDYQQALRKTVEYYNHMASVSQVMTPDPQINLGVTWAKVNMLRVMANYPTGPAFTNDPSRSSAVVGRDACWFSAGCDFLLPQFSRALLESLAARQREDGLIVEYYNAVTDERAYNGFNINDNTPLFIWAVWHHYLATGDHDFLQRIYPAVWKAGQCILRARDAELDVIPAERKHGLIICNVRGVEVYGIAGWRNIIPNYTLNGAVTEVNAECAAALRSAARLGEARGTPESHEDARQFSEAGEALVTAINTHLLNPENGLYYLNIDLDGNIHTDVTADEIYPVLFEVAPKETSFRIISRLNSPDFWTTAGIRTVSRMSPSYDPYRQWGLLGGVWPGVAWWYAFAARDYHPESMVQALRASFEHYAHDPKKNLTVPGEFSEWMDGESLVNRGMRLSPWEPPRFVLAAIQGICGVRIEPDSIKMKPTIPKDWRWAGMRRFPHHGRELAFFGCEQSDGAHLYGTLDVSSNGRGKAHHYDEDVTPNVYSRSPQAQHLAFRKPGEVLVCVGSPAAQTIQLPLRLDALLDPHKRYHVEIYNSELNQWITGATASGKDLEESAVAIEAGGYRLLRFHEQSA
ncbi:MAG TPA: amylo-alpha-1,6-glucosidase [Ktedonobacterales bacterium]|nr:amylo-alpha-1,6-glucosidase [Ktedonobacterales bacterium]